ncbi:MAG: hypothetical protein DMG08_16825 [Acidobacteria bacterium]|nr:MAG: hypothetical protein DMG08_16825 [Acidobacteriota bacterium]
MKKAAYLQVYDSLPPIDPTTRTIRLLHYLIRDKNWMHFAIVPVLGYLVNVAVNVSPETFLERCNSSMKNS